MKLKALSTALAASLIAGAAHAATFTYSLDEVVLDDGGTVTGEIQFDTVLNEVVSIDVLTTAGTCLLYTSPSPRDRTRSRMPSSA